jgi:hypothetical protein
LVEENTPFDSPISNFYVLNEAGIPLFARYYQDRSIDSILFAGFLSAIEVFTRTSLGDNLTDIGMENGTRYFFHRSDHGYLSVISTPVKSINAIDPLQMKIIHIILEKFNLVIDLIVKVADAHEVVINVLAEGLGNMVDSIILESTLEFTPADDLSLATSYVPTNFEQGKNIDSSEFNQILATIQEKVKSFFG